MSRPNMKITHEQLREEFEAGNTVAGIARKYGMSQRVVRIRKAKLKESGYDPDNERHYKNPETQVARGYSTLTRLKDKDDPTPGKMMEWSLMRRSDQEIIKQFEAIAEAFTKSIPKASPAPQIKPAENTDLIPWYSLGDSHIGLCCEEQEVGESFDLDIAKSELCAAIKRLIDMSPATERCVINDAGDALHYDSAWGNAKTPRSGHDLQQSGTFSDMLEVYIDCIRFAVSYALTKHNIVDVIINQGNHSKTCDISNRVWFVRYYESEPRVNFLDNRNILIPYRMGNALIVNTHTDNMKPRRVAEAASIDFRQDWGECKYRIIFGGHLHHYMKKDEFGAIYYCLNNIAANDKHGSWGGWRSRSFLTVHYVSKTYGEQGERRITAEEVQDSLHNLDPGTSVNKRRKVYTV